MKMSKKWTSSILFGWVVVAGVIGCAEKEYGSTEEMFADLPRYALEEGQKLPIDLIGAYAGDIVVMGDYLLTTHDVMWGGMGYGVGIYDRRNGELLKEAVFPGGGPDQYNMVTCIEPLNDSVFYISTTNGKDHIAFYNLHHLQDEDVFRPFYYIDLAKIRQEEKEFYKGYKGSLDAPLVSTADTTIVARAYEKTNTTMMAVYKPGEGLPRYCINYPASQNEAKEKQMPPMGRYALYQGRMAINDRGNKVFNAFSSVDGIYFYHLEDGELKPFKIYEYSTTSSGTNGTSYGLTGKSATYYYRVHWHDGRVYVLSIGGRTINERIAMERRQSDRMEQGEKEETFMKMLVFSDEGKPLHTLYLDVNPNDFRFSGDTLYVLRTNGEGDSEILSYNMRNMKPLEESPILLAKRDRR